MRPWNQATPLPLTLRPKIEGQFNSFDEWVSHATRALGDQNEYAPMMCVDNVGRRCYQGGCFSRARDEGTFPIRYFYEFEPLELGGAVDELRERLKTAALSSAVDDEIEQTLIDALNLLGGKMP